MAKNDDRSDAPANPSANPNSNAPARRSPEQPENASPAIIAGTLKSYNATLLRLFNNNSDAVTTFGRACMRHYAHTTNPDFVGDWAAGKMQAVDPQSYVLACIDAAADGLLPDGKQGTIVPRGKVAVWTPMWRGLAELARRGNPGLELQAHVVYQVEVDNGLFVADLVRGIERHTPWQLSGIRYEPKDEDIIGAYAVATFRNKQGVITRQEWRMLWRDNLIKRAEQSGNPKNKEWSPAWRQWFPEMSKGKAIRALCDWMEIGTAFADAIERHDERERSAVRQIDNPPEPQHPSNGAQRNALADEIRGAGASLPEGRS